MNHVLPVQPGQGLRQIARDPANLPGVHPATSLQASLKRLPAQLHGQTDGPRQVPFGNTEGGAELHQARVGKLAQGIQFAPDTLTLVGALGPHDLDGALAAGSALHKQLGGVHPTKGALTQERRQPILPVQDLAHQALRIEHRLPPDQIRRTVAAHTIRGRDSNRAGPALPGTAPQPGEDQPLSMLAAEATHFEALWSRDVCRGCLGRVVSGQGSRHDLRHPFAPPQWPAAHRRNG